MQSMSTKRVRTREPSRAQGVMLFEVPDATLADDHRARLFWLVVETLDLSAFTAGAKAVEGRQGRPLSSVRMLLTLWLYAITEGVGSARKIERLTREDVAFRWIVGDQRISHDRLSAFRVSHLAALEGVFTDVVAALQHKGLLSLELVAQDGTRVRASASAPSFRGADSLEQCRKQAALHLKAVLAEQDDPEASEREKKARLAAARDYERRVKEALETVKQLRKPGKPAPRASTTDPEARVMKMADGGFRPGYNIQMATAGSPMGGARTIVGVRVTNVGSDMGSVTPMLAQIEQRTGQLPKRVLADANHADHDCVRYCAARGVEAHIAVPARSQRLGPASDRDEPIVAWRQRMCSEAGKTQYRARAGLCELPNAHLKHHCGLTRLLVRGLDKATCVALLTGLAINLVQNAAHLLA
jgi:transposase